MMISSLSELEKIKDRYCKADSHYTRGYKAEAREIATENFWWVLQAAISATEKCEKPTKPKHTIADNYPAGGLTATEPCMFCESSEKLKETNEQLQAENERLQTEITARDQLIEALEGDIVLLQAKLGEKRENNGN